MGHFPNTLLGEALSQGADTPVPVPVPVPDLSGDGDGVTGDRDGASVPDFKLPGPRPGAAAGTLPRPRPRFAEIGDQALVLEYPKGVEGFAQVWSHNSQITRRSGQLCPDSDSAHVRRLRREIYLTTQV